MGIIDRRARVIHVSPAIDHEGKRRFVKMHETAHHILPHQQDLLYAEDHETLSPATNRLFEREANQGAAELLFQRGGFARDAADLKVSVAAIWQLAGQIWLVISCRRPALCRDSPGRHRHDRP